MLNSFTHKNYSFSCEYPNQCPICNDKISPIREAQTFNEDIDLVSILFTCTSCGKGFISHYQYDETKVEGHGYNEVHILSIINSYPNHINKIEFDNKLDEISPTFVDIYNQANSAEIYELNQLAGIGYRKALEFLIKDYCIYRNNNDDNKIKSMLLSQVIEKYIDSIKIKKLAMASAWLGNDETHYIRKFQDKDINDLKKFIQATVAYITYELISDEASELVSSK